MLNTRVGEYFHFVSHTSIMEVVIYLLAILNLSVVLSAQNFSWDNVKGVNLVVEPVSHDYAVDEPINGRIIGGFEIVPNTMPFQVGLLINGQGFCSGTLVSPNYVLTAAHCTASATYVELIFGAHNIYVEESTQLRVTSSSIITHPQYKVPYEHSNDISLINTPIHIVTNNYIHLVKLPSASVGNYEGYSVALTGWGSTSGESSSMATGLHLAFDVVMDNKSCGDIFGGNYSESANMCTHGTGPVGGCNGDSGAPMTYSGYQIGILSFVASESCTDGLPNGFTRVSHYREWINQHAGL